MAVELPASFPSATFPESPMEGDDVVYPCKGCGEILEEGKAFELAGNRWHIDCFRCNTCGTLLDSDANLLLLGDGSLICNNCTYSCNACGNKIEDLAILTGDQAFCASCFRCRNCKRKIENLRYARTSQGIFCMTCHESLMAKRRKHKKQRAANNMNKDKSLPDLPQDMSSMSSMPDNVFELATPANEPTADPIEQTDSDRRSSRRRGESKDFGLRDSTSGAQSGNDTLTLPASTYTATSSASRGKAPMELETTESTGMDDGLFVPFILDPSPAPTVAASPYVDEHTGKVLSPPPEPPSGVVELSARDSVIPRKLPASAIPRVPASSSSRASSPDRATGSPQRTNRQISGNKRGDSLSSPPPQSSGLNNSFADALSGPSSFKLQDVPKHRRGDSSRSLEGSHYNDDASTTGKSTYSTTDDTDFSQTTVTSDATQEKKKLQDHTVSRTGSVLKRGKPSGEQSSTSIPKRGDSLQNSARMQGQDRKDVEQPGRSTSSPAVSKKSTGAVAPQSSFESTAAQSDGKINPLATSTMPRSGDPPSIPPARSSSRPAASPNPALSDAFISPRAAPPPPPQAQAQTTSYPSAPQHKASESTSTMRSELSIQMSPVNLPRYSTGGDFSMQEDLDRILRGEGEQTPPGMLRKMSNAMKGHGRSFSDRGLTSGTSSSKYSTRSPLNGMEISSPTLATSPSGSSRDDLLSDTKHKLQRAERRIAELESEKHRILHSSADFSEVDTKLKEKRTTMAFLETQRELVIRELEVMTDNLKRAKDSNQPLNLKTLKSDVLADLNASVKDLKESLSKEIETLVQKRDSITNEISDLIAMKDKGIQEYESLSSRNTQLTQHNNELIHSIQDFYKANRQPNGSSFDGGRPQLPNGLGIQLGITTPKTDEARMLYGNENSVPSSIQESEQDSMISTPQVVNIRKPKKANMLKKGTAGFLRGARGIFSADDNNRMERDQPLTIGVPYTQQPDGQIPRSGQPPQKYGLFGNEKMQQGPTKLTNLKHSHTNSSNPNLVADAAAGAQSLFGSDLTVRCNLEGRVIPAIVARCIEEVEIRGMDVEGIYRKSGGSGQVNQLKSGFEAIAPTSTETFDISDVDLDIHAVTSTLKQYFRRLPVPLITYDVYDSLLEAVRVEDIEKRVVVMRECLDTLPRCHRDCLEFLVFHLGRVMEKAQFNLMTPLNLAVVFAPTVLRPQSIEREMTDMQTQRNAIQFILENSKSIFADA